MASPRVFVTDGKFAHFDAERTVVEAAGFTLQTAQLSTEAELLAAGIDAEALIVQFAPITRRVIESLRRCRVLVRYGIGYDNIDLEAARDKGIAVCNVTDYGINEVADHTLALALSLARQIPFFDQAVRAGQWLSKPTETLAGFADMTYVTVGFGRIARAVHERARVFHFHRKAYDPYVSSDEMEAVGVTKVTLDEAFQSADVLSLHLPLSAETRSLVDARRLASMKPTSVLINTARGPLVDTIALATHLNERRIASAGLDVYEQEPLPIGHPLRSCPWVLLTSHVAWYSEASVPRLQRMAAEEAVRGIRGEPLKNQVNAQEVRR